MKTAIIYTRAKVNLSDCDLFSVSTQLKTCKEFAEKNGLQVCGIRSDVILSGTPSNFSAWESITRNKKPEYDCIIVHDYSRIGRNTEKAIKDIIKLKARQIYVLSVKENFTKKNFDEMTCFYELLQKEYLK